MRSTKRPSKFVAVVNTVLTLAVICGFIVFKHVTAPPNSIADLIEMYATAPENEVPLHSVAERELIWLTKGGYFEARGEAKEGQIAALVSMLHRVWSKKYPNTIEGVIRQDEERRNRCQYSFMCDGEKEEIKDAEAWEAMIQLAEKLYRQFRAGELDLGCAHSYHADYVEGRWHKKALRFDRKVGTHLFYCDKDSMS